MLIINLLNASVEVDGAAGVLEVVAGVVNVDAVVLVCLVALQLVSGVPKKTLGFFVNREFVEIIDKLFFFAIVGKY